MNQDRLVYTDGWHPAILPSSRMVTHHFRFAELFGAISGILNEHPRHKGGCTFRFLRFDEQGFHIDSLPTPFAFVPWWLAATEENADRYLFSCYRQALAHPGAGSSPDVAY